MARQSKGGASARVGRGRAQRWLAWSAQDVALVTQRWAEGVSAAAIARELGPGVSRCAVIGKLRRLGIPPRREGREQAPRRHPVRRASVGAHRPELALALEALFAASRFGRLARVAEETVLHPDAGRAFGVPCTLMQLGAHTCRWPVGEPGTADFAFCGAVPLQARPYCAVHWLIAGRSDDSSRPRAPRPPSRAGAAADRAA